MDVGMTANLPAVVAQPAPERQSEDLNTHKRLFQEARDLTATARENAAKCQRYYDSDQISAADLKVLKARKQPVQIDNCIKPMVNGITGVVERGKTDPRAYPRTPQDQAASEVATDVLRYIADDQRWHRTKLASFREAVIRGTAAVIVEVDDRLNVKITRGRPEEFFYDPYSREPDFSDASYMGFAKWVYLDAAVRAYPEHEEELRASCRNGDTGDSLWGDRPYSGGAMSWTDATRGRLLMVEMYRLAEGIWRKAVFVGSLMLEAGDSPYLDANGMPENPIVAFSPYVDSDNKRYGPVWDALSLQDGVNNRKSKMLFLGNVRQIQQVTEGAAEIDAEGARREAARPDGVIPAGWQVVPTSDMFSANFQLLQADKEAMERNGVNPAILGRQGENQSGRANLVRQQAGLTEQADLYGGLEDFEWRVYGKAWARVKQYWSEPRFLRVTDDEKAFRFVHVNQPIYEIQTVMIGQNPWTGEPVYGEQQVQVGVANNVAEMEVDIIIDSVPDTANVQQEQFQALVDLARAGYPVPPEVLFEAAALPKKREILEKVQAASQQPNPAQEAAQRAANAKAAREEAEIGKTVAETQETQADTALKAQQAASPMLMAGWPQG